MLTARKTSFHPVAYVNGPVSHLFRIALHGVGLPYLQALSRGLDDYEMELMAT